MAKITPSNRRGLLAAGNWIIDQVKIIDVYPQPEQLGNIRRQSQGTGGAPYNVLIDLAKCPAPFPLMGAMKSCRCGSKQNLPCSSICLPALFT